MPHNFHRPTREELLAAATGFWSRLRARFKWFTIRSGRPFNVDEISALFSWVLLGHVVWIIVGTTTFFSLAILVINTVFAQETLAQWIGNYLTQSSGIKVVFESAVVPKWGSGVISFKKVFVSRRPGQGKAKVSKGSQAEAAAAAAAAKAALGERHIDVELSEEEDTNYTQFDVSIDTVDVTLSFAKWFNGKGLLKDVDVNGVRGVVDRTSVRPTGVPVDPKTYRKEHNYGDFELDSFKLSDLLVTVYQPRDFRPFTVSIYSCDLPQLRKQWLFYDFMSANTISGSFDNSLFTIHPRQTHNYTGLQLDEGAQWKKHSRIRIDGLNIDHLNRGVAGPFSWIHEGNVDVVADILLPADNDGSIAKVMSDFYDRMEATVTANNQSQPQEQVVSTADYGTTAIRNDQLAHLSDEKESKQSHDEDDKNRFLIMDIRVHFNNVRAAVPLFTNDLSYINNALIRPIVAYINSKRSFIPVNCRVVKQLSDFDGSWTVFDSGLMDDLSQEMYEAFARDVINDKQARKRRFRKVGVWTLQLAAQALFLGLAGNVA
ncbi:putative mitochondrion biogenesis protein [Rhizodiscina lignyota]|uniref:Mitochondrion biogenesis protein n=1 Tax=Rhizodiscina lignyota TaxID=1504668 RepID=A0A9P4MAV6_9PEZI|nr:putative mitochondrion biogenesis protein [Rhizodiscina lignyota]